MAGRPKKEENMNESKIEKTEPYNPDRFQKLEKENEELKSQLNLILEKLEKQEKSIVTNNSVNTNNTVPEIVKKEENHSCNEISPLKLIKVISLSHGGVSLKTRHGGDGKIFRFDKFGHSIPITYSDLQDIIATNRSFIEDGSVYICDEDVIKNNYLEDVYSKFLTIETINNIFSFPTNKIIDMVKNTTETIQESLISFVIKKINNNEYVDMNKVEAIGKSCKNPCNILELAQQKRMN